MSAQVFSRSEIDRIRDSVLPHSPDNHKSRKRAELKALSQDRLKHWPNTLEAARLKKESYLAERAAKEEEARMEIDRIEAEHSRTQRLEAIRRANALMYDQTDKMKGLKSQRAYADVIHYRETQVQERLKREADETEWGKQFHVAILERVAKGEAEEEEKKQRHAKTVKILAVARKEQVDEVRAQKAAERAVSDAIGQAIKDQAKKQQEDDYAAAVAKQARIAESNAAMVVANEKLLAVRRQILAQEEEAAAARDAEKDVIEGRKKALKALEIRRFEKSQETRQKIIDAAVKQLAAKSNKDEALLEKQVGEAKEKQEKAFADKEAKIAKQAEDIRMSRNEMLANKKRLEEQAWAVEDRLVKMQREANEIEIQREKVRG